MDVSHLGAVGATRDAGWSTMRPGARGVAVGFAVSGTAHLIRPRIFRPLIPPFLPAPNAWIAATGVAELACAVGLATGRRWAPAATAGTLLLVWPGNGWHAITTQRSSAHPLVKAGVWARLPLQLPMITAALNPYRAAAGPVTIAD
jgi:uncharacterized membrane protein